MAIGGEAKKQDTGTPDRIILVHGTWASSPGEPESGWYKPSGGFRTYLNDALQGIALCDDDRMFSWTGDNTETAREKAAHDLLQEIRNVDDAGTPFHLIGHSHGGTIIWRALQLSERRPLRRLRSWTTIGTPFLHYSLDRSRLWFLAPLIVCSAGVAAIAPRIAPYWEVWSELWATEPWSASAALVLLVGVACITVLAAYPAVRLALAACRLWQRERATKAAWRRYGRRYTALWSSEDEAILGLQSSVTLRHGILEKDTRSAPWPLRWPRGVWNQFFGRPIDEFIWRWIRNFAQGCDHGPFVLTTVTPYPVSKRRVRNALDPQVDQSMSAAANKALSAAGTAVRPALAAAAVARNSLVMLKDRLGTTSMGFLIHCQYTQQPRIWEQVATMIRERHAGGRCPRGRSQSPWSLPRAALRGTDARNAGVACAAFASLTLVLLALLEPTLSSYTREAVLKDALRRADDMPLGRMSWHDHNLVRLQFLAALSGAGRFEDAIDDLQHVKNPYIKAQAYQHLANRMAETGSPDLRDAVIAGARHIVESPRTRGEEDDRWFQVDVSLLKWLLAIPGLASDRGLQELRAKLLDACEADAARPDLLAVDQFLELAHILGEDSPEEKARAQRLIRKAAQACARVSVAPDSELRRLMIPLRNQVRVAFVAGKAGDIELAKNLAQGVLHDLPTPLAASDAVLINEVAGVFELSGDEQKAGELHAEAQRLGAQQSESQRADGAALLNVAQLTAAECFNEAEQQIAEISDPSSRSAAYSELELRKGVRHHVPVQDLARLGDKALEAALQTAEPPKSAALVANLERSTIRGSLPETRVSVWDAASELIPGHLRDAAILLGAKRILGREADAGQHRQQLKQWLRGSDVPPGQRVIGAVFLYLVAPEPERDASFGDAVAALRSFPEEKRGAGTDYGKYGEKSVTILYQSIQHVPEQVEQLVEAIRTSRNDQFRLIAMGCVAEAAADRGRGSLAVRVVGAILDDPMLGEMASVSNILRKPTSALVKAGFLRRALELSRFHDLQGKMETLKQVITATAPKRPVVAKQSG